MGVKTVQIKKIILITSLLFSGLAFSASNDVVVTGIHSVYDGDTFRAFLPPHNKESQRVRLRGVDTPEIKGQCKSESDNAIRARDFVRLYLSRAKLIELKSVGRDKYKRVLADVHVDGVNLAQVLINNKLGRKWRGRRENWCD
jgi:micrococcal nuclease|tara:strand:- start:12532 stop:12960 length:429 start_codon:yes stop_codon:yes gene_type:complete